MAPPGDLRKKKRPATGNLSRGVLAAVFEHSSGLPLTYEQHVLQLDLHGAGLQALHGAAG